jgi:hypothetical protein
MIYNIINNLKSVKEAESLKYSEINIEMKYNMK